MRHRIALGALVALAALTFAANAFAHARVSPPVAVAKDSQVFTLAVPTEKENATDDVDRADAAGRLRDRLVRSGRRAGSEPCSRPAPATPRSSRRSPGAAARCRPARTRRSRSSRIADAAKTYTFAVRQTYSDGSVVDWNGPESSDTPAPTLKAVSSFGGGTSTLEHRRACARCDRARCCRRRPARPRRQDTGMTARLIASARRARGGRRRGRHRRCCSSTARRGLNDAESDTSDAAVCRGRPRARPRRGRAGRAAGSPRRRTPFTYTRTAPPKVSKRAGARRLPQTAKMSPSGVRPAK